MAEVWKYISDIPSQTTWMQDAVAIRFVSAVTNGVGAEFECDTKIGPFQVIDRLVVTEWEPERVLAIRHQGMFTGTGRFSLREQGQRRTLLVWEERLNFPWWMAGPLGGAVASPILRQVWRGNLRRLGLLIELGQTSSREARRQGD